ncbi:MAG TPA: efflux RND transporter periplasmic adaptor subunit [Steroidobacteraceae bacterium]|nr:efflux RND transporter periplasmic adaptor subunit [Steroidobacteraceae bacterium]
MDGGPVLPNFHLVGTDGGAAGAPPAQSIHAALHLSGTPRKLLAAAAALVLVAAAAMWWAGQRTAAPRYLTTAVSRGAVAPTVSATGTVNPVLTIIVGSYVSGVISAMSCDYNTRVRKGQLCAKIDPRPYESALEQARGQLARDEAQLQGARVNLARYAELEKQDSIARQTYEDEAALVRQLQGTVQLDRAAARTAEVNLEYTNIVSPVDGTVVARNITIGQTVAASFQTPTLFLIATDLTKMQVDTNVPESDIGAVREGDDARFTVEAFSDHAFPGRVVQVRQAPQSVQNVVTYDVVVAADNGQFLLKPGMTATVAIVTDRRADVLRVPGQALRFVPAGVQAPSPAGGAGGGAAQRVWVLRNGLAAPVAVRTGVADDSYSEVVAGELKPGDQVIVGEQRASASAPAGSLRFGLGR